jgi:hypothetical protein
MTSKPYAPAHPGPGHLPPGPRLHRGKYRDHGRAKAPRLTGTSRLRQGACWVCQSGYIVSVSCGARAARNADMP